MKLSVKKYESSSKDSLELIMGSRESYRNEKPETEEWDSGSRSPEEPLGYDGSQVTFYREVKNIPRLSPQDEQRLGRQIKETQAALIDLTIKVKTSFLPFCSFQNFLRQWTQKEKSSKEPIDLIFKEIDRMISIAEGLDRTDPELVKYCGTAKALREKLMNTMREMVRSNLGLAICIARRYKGRGLPVSDLIQDACVGMIKAAFRYDYSMGFRFSTFAGWWIRQAINKALVSQGEIIRLPEHVHNKNTQVHRAYVRLIKELGREPTYGEIAEQTGLSWEDVINLVQVNRKPVSLETLLSDDGDRLCDVMENPDAVSPLDVVQKSEMVRLLRIALDSLPERDRQVLALRYGLGDQGPCTLAELGRNLNISRERARQLEARAVKKLRRYLNRFKAGDCV